MHPSRGASAPATSRSSRQRPGYSRKSSTVCSWRPPPATRNDRSAPQRPPCGRYRPPRGQQRPAAGHPAAPPRPAAGHPAASSGHPSAPRGQQRPAAATPRPPSAPIGHPAATHRPPAATAPSSWRMDASSSSAAAARCSSAASSGSRGAIARTSGTTSVPDRNARNITIESTAARYSRKSSTVCSWRPPIGHPRPPETTDRPPAATDRPPAATDRPPRGHPSATPRPSSGHPDALVDPVLWSCQSTWNTQRFVFREYSAGSGEFKIRSKYRPNECWRVPGSSSNGVDLREGTCYSSDWYLWEVSQ